MKGIYFINDRISINGYTKESSFELQQQAILDYVQTHKIEVVKLNPYQFNEYYTIPHALLYDLKKERPYLDCFIYYSSQTMEDFIYTYPAKWLILKSFFNQMITVDKVPDLTVKKIV
nr:hypothetical protein [Neobacillus sp. Marseille-Q6967]